MKQALQRAEERASRHRTANHVAVAAFFFNARGSVLERNPLGLFRSLLRQLLQQIRPLLSGFLPSFLQKNEPWQDWSWSLEELREHFYTAVTQAQGHSIVIFVDALDECDEESVRKTVEFFERAALSAVSAGCDLRICLSSRHYTNINIRNCFEIRTEDCNKTDISKYVRTKLAIGTRVSNFEEIINAKASGTFLWVVLVVTRLSEAKRNGESTNTLLDILKSAPIGLRELFRQIAGAIPEAERRETAQMMLWVLLSERSLTPTELRYALASKFPYKSQKEYEESPEFVADDEHMEELLRKRTMGLIEVTRAGQGMACIVQFIHESVRDFLLRENGLHIVDPSLGGGAIGEGHSQIVKSCINYVSAEELLVSPEVIDERGPSRSSRYLLQVLAINYPFLNYSVTSLFEHAVKAEREGVSQAHLSHDFQDDAFDSWRYHSDLIKHGRFTDREGSQTTLLHTVSEYGLFTATDALLKQGVDVNAKGGREGNALVASAGAGHNQIVQLLLENGADVNAKGTHSTALQAASSKGHYEVVELLLRNGADVHAPGPLGTALQVASSRNRYKIAELLLEKGADVNAQGGGGGNALHSAAFDGYVEIAKLLLENGANVNAQEGAYSNPLLAASMMGRSQMVELLLEAGADVTVRDGDYGSNALQTASSFNHSAVVALLLAKGADVNAQGGVYGTALQAASYSGCSQTATLLLEKGADVNAQAGDYGTALQAASLMGHTATASLLLQHGADVNAQAGRHSSALQAAACNGHAETAALLLAHHADVNAHGGRDGSALQAAAFAGHTPVVSLLLEHAADVGALGGRYGTALGAAEDAGHGEIVAVLRARGA
ncbi:MAG: hypothetical protein M1839_004624 [Geoglossum umbratile]|nr:MAG: hypothetical protein M1839_004624 [Geoglossum umbratile]